MPLDTSLYRVRPGRRLRLSRFDPHDDGGQDKAAAEKRFRDLRDQLIGLQKTLYADGSRALLVVLQGMDTSGKDNTTRWVFAGCSPSSMSSANFKAPTSNELARDYLWRIHQAVPRKGSIGIFNRSHYEDVLIARVRKLVPPARWKLRFRHINDFERLLHDEGTTIVKFFLHISKGYQKDRLQRRLARPDKQWKFDPADLVDRQLWDDYMTAHEEALARSSNEYAPWYIVPAEQRWFRNLLVTQVLVETLTKMKLRYPKVDFDPRSVVID